MNILPKHSLKTPRGFRSIAVRLEFANLLVTLIFNNPANKI
jgi:hypothetical protein